MSRVLLLTADRIPLRPITVEKAISQIYSGIYYSVKDHPTQVFRSPSITIPRPLVVAPYRHVPLPSHYFGPANLNNANLFLRDKFICVYCKTEHPSTRLTCDHVIPRSKGGRHSWENVVTACEQCNGMKDNKLHTKNDKGHFVWNLIDPWTGTEVELVLEKIPRTPTKAAITTAKHIRRGLISA